MNLLEHYIHSYFDVPTSSLSKIASLFKTETLAKGEYFSKTGGKCRRMSFVNEGLVRIFVSLEDKDVTQWISKSGYFVTDLSAFMFDEPARWNIQALTETKVYSIYQSDYQKIGEIVPEWHALERRFLASCFTTLEDRVFSHLSMSAEERYLHFFENNKELFNEVQLKYLASMLGMTPETLSRIRANAGTDHRPSKTSDGSPPI